jgi:hypothetical protein
MSAIRNLAGQTAIYGLLSTIGLLACTINNSNEVIGDWRTEVKEGHYGVVRFHRNGQLWSWVEPSPPEGSNVHKGSYRLKQDSIALLGERGEGNWFAIRWSDKNLVRLTGQDTSLLLTRIADEHR